MRGLFVMPKNSWILKSTLKNFQFTHFLRLTYYHWAFIQPVPFHHLIRARWSLMNNKV